MRCCVRRRCEVQAADEGSLAHQAACLAPFPSLLALKTRMEALPPVEVAARQPVRPCTARA